MSKGISPLIAAVLLIAITVSISAILTGWFTGLTRSTTVSVTNRTALAIDCTTASLAIDSVYAQANTTVNTTARVVIRNDGLVAYRVMNAAFVNGTGNSFSALTALPISLDRGGVASLSFNVTMASCPGAFSRVTVTTDCGGVSSTFQGNPVCLT